MNSPYIFTILLFVSFISCNDAKENNHFIFDDSEFQIIEVNYLKSMLLSKIVQNINYIPLETSDSALIGNITKMLIYDSTFYIYDRNINQGVFGFDFQGNNKFVISDIGGGEGRFQLTTNVEVSDYGIELIDQANFSILNYTLNGDFIDEISNSFYIAQIKRTKRNSVILLASTPAVDKLPNGSNNTLYHMSGDFKRINSSYFPYAACEESLESGILCEYNSRITYVRSYLGRFYYFDDEMKLKPRFKIDFGKYKIPEELLFSDNLNMIEEKFFNGEYANLIGRLLETKDYFFFQFYIGGVEDPENVYFAILEKTSGKCVAVKEIVNDIDGGAYRFPIATYNDQLISSIDAEEFVDIYSKNRNMYNNLRLDSITNSLKLFKQSHFDDTTA